MTKIISQIVKKFDSSANRNECSILDMLATIEAQIDCYSEFDAHVKKLTNDDIEKDKLPSPYTNIEDFYNSSIKKIKKEKRKDTQQKKADIEEKAIRKKQDERKAKKDKIPPMGVRRAMDIASKPKQKKAEKKKVLLTEDQQAMLKYIGEEFMVKDGEEDTN